MALGTPGRGHVLVVDDEHDVADTQALRLRDHYETSVAYGGNEALEMAGPEIDAILLDRRMPDIHGDEVLDRLRERGYEGKVIMLTAVDPDLNILEMAFDDYLQKPVDRETLLSTLEQHLDGAVRDDRLEEYFEVSSKLAVLEGEKSPSELDSSEEYAELEARADELEWQLRTELDDFDAIVETYRAIDRGSS
ncbi:response regulator transcription factor [Haloarcula marina]|uniref:response regulator transcription factor n=1 Tax=Haloarcula marina TaxID=2961574 RepID=UPI0020B8B684|nr:HalX domain-containing protein [Halomicroarcula marina]